MIIARLIELKLVTKMIKRENKNSHITKTDTISYKIKDNNICNRFCVVYRTSSVPKSVLRYVNIFKESVTCLDCVPFMAVHNFE